MNFNTILGPMRAPFLVLAPVCVFLGIGCTWWLTGALDGWQVMLALLGGLAAHISVNTLNEYFDFKSGLDFLTQRTPFSGGSGTLPQNPRAVRSTLATGLAAMGICVLIGIHFTLLRDWRLIPLGLIGLVVVLTYTVWLNYSVVLCLLAPGLGFGTLMVMGSVFSLGGSYTMTSFTASLAPFFLVSNLLLLNQFPDVDADRSIGRKNWPVVYGRRSAAVVYMIFMALAYLSILLGAGLGWLPPFCLLGLGTSIIAVPTARNVLRFADDVPKLIPSLGANVLIVLLTPLLMGIGFFLK